MGRATNKRPQRQFQAGPIFAAIWSEPRKTGNGESMRYSIQIEKRYRDERTGKWHSTSYLRPDDLPKLVLVANRVFEDLFFKARDEHTPQRNSQNAGA